MSGAIDCSIFPSFTSFYDACVKSNQMLGYDAHGNKLNPNAPTTTPNSSFLGIPLPSSDWWRHMMVRAGEVIIGIAMVVVGIKALANSGDTTKVIVQGAKKVMK